MVYVSGLYNFRDRRVAPTLAAPSKILPGGRRVAFFSGRVGKILPRPCRAAFFPAVGGQPSSPAGAGSLLLRRPADFFSGGRQISSSAADSLLLRLSECLIQALINSNTYSVISGHHSMHLL
jgi:hypothetical protein